MSSQIPQVSMQPDPRWSAAGGGNTIEGEPFVGYGGFWLRVIAALIDWVLLSIVVGALTAPTAFTLTPPVGIVVHWLYEAGMTASNYRATLGKLAVGLKVTDYAGRQLSFARATGRHFAKWLSAAVLLIGYIMVAFTDRKRGLHDLIAGTLVLKSSPPPGGPIASTGP